MAQVDNKGRILYYVGGKPVYSNDDEYGFYKASDFNDRGFNPYDEDKDEDHGHHGLRKDRDFRRDDKKDKDDRDRDKNRDKGEKNQKIASYRLVRAKDGTLRVQYVDTKTGKVLTGNDLKSYKIQSSASGLQGIYSQKPDFNKNETSKDGDKKTEDEDVETKEERRLRLRDERHQDNFSDHNRSGGKSNSPGSSKSGAPSGQSTNSNSSEQGDTSSTERTSYDPSTNKITFSPSLAAQKSVNNQALGLPDPYSGMTQPTVTSVTPEGFTHPAYDTSLDKYGDGIVAGNVKAPFEGQNLDDAKIVGSMSPEYSDQEKMDMAKTLAGEVDTRFTDLATPEGVNETNNIMSTMVNRDEVQDGGLSDTIHAPLAYSTWNTPEDAANANANYNKNPSLWDGMVDRFLADPSLRTPVTNYYNPSLVNPSWSKNLLDKEQIGPHMFGIDPSLSVPTRSLTDEQKEAVEREHINTSFENSPAYAGAPSIANTAPDFSGPLGTNLGNFPDAMVDTNTSNFGPGFAASSDMDRYGSPSVTSMDAGRFASTNEQGGNRAKGITASRDYTDPSLDTGFTGPSSFMSTPNVNSLDSVGDRLGTTNRFATPVNDPSKFGPSISPNSLGFYGGLTNGFGTNVTTDENAAANSGIVAATNEAQVTNSVTGPTGLAEGYQASKDYSAPSLSSTPANTVNDAASVSNTNSTGFDHTEGIAGETSTPGVSSTTGTSTGEGTDTSVSTDTSTTGTAPDTTGGGIFGGIFGGDTSTDSTSTGTTGTTSDTGADVSADTDTDTGGFSDGYL